MGVSSKLRHSKISKILVLISGIVLLGFLLISFFISKEVKFKEQIIIDTSLTKLYPKVSDLYMWRSWTVWDEEYYKNQFDRKTEYLTNQIGQVIKSLEYAVSEVNDSASNTPKLQPTLVIERKTVVTNTVPTTEALTNVTINFNYSMWDNNRGNTGEDSTPMLTAQSGISLSALGKNQYEVSWEYVGDYSPVIGNNPLQKYFLIFTKMSLKRAYKQSLQRLKEVVE